MLSAKASNIPTAIQKTNEKQEIVSWGKKNEYPYFLNFLFKKNPIHAGIIRAKRYFTVSGGMKYEGPNQSAFEEFFKNKKQNHNDKDIFAVTSEISLDYEKSNTGIYKVLFNKIGDKVYRKTERIPFEKFRYEIVKDEKTGLEYLTGNIRVCDNWLDEKANIETIEPYRKNDEEQRVCFVMFQEESGQSIDDMKATYLNPGIYADPPYGGAITAIDTGIQILEYNNAEIHNGFSLGTLIYLANGKIKDEKHKKDLEHDLGASTTGPLQSGRSMVIYGNGQNEKPTIEALNGNNLPDRYNNTKKGSEESTVQGHLFTSPTLAGIKTEGSLGDSKELRTAYAILKQNYIKARQDEILNALNWIMNEIAGVDGTITFNDVELDLPQEENTNPQFQVNLGEQKQEDKILQRLQVLGKSKDQFNIVHSVSLKGHELSNDEIFAEYKSQFADLQENQQQTLNLINEGQDYNTIKKALEISGMELANIYQTLQAGGFITDKGALTEQGIKQVSISEVASMEIMFEYRLRPGAPELVPGGTSRDFCKELIRLNRLYTREDIQRISGVEGYDVFSYRGGWYHNPNSGKNEPGCRHEWAQVITFKS